MVVIRTENLRKQFGSVVAVESLDMEVGEGTVFGLIGPNGAGKTTTLRMLLDLIRPSSGSATVMGVSPKDGGADLRRRIGYLPGELRLNGNVKGSALLAQLAEISGPIRPGVISNLTERLEVDLTRPVRTLSKGNKQKIGLIQAFMHHPELLILDEPTSGLDPLVQREFLEMVREAKKEGQTVLLSSHVLSEIQRTADEVIVLSDGKVVASGDVDSLRLSSVRRVHATLAGAPSEPVLAELVGVQNLKDVDVSGNDPVTVSATCHGEIDPVIRALTSFTIKELTIEEPDLEESVLALYSDKEQK